MKHKILDLIERYWKFDNDQQPISSWHDKQDLLKAVEDELIFIDSDNETDVFCECKKLYSDNKHGKCSNCGKLRIIS